MKSLRWHSPKHICEGVSKKKKIKQENNFTEENRRQTCSECGQNYLMRWGSKLNKNGRKRK